MARVKSITGRIVLAAVVLAIVGAGVALLVLATPTGPGSGSVARRIADAFAGDDDRIEVPDWIADRLLTMVNDRLRPQLGFSDLSYDPPFTITLTDAVLETPEGERVVEVETLVITLAERPKKGEPLRFAGVSLRSGTVRLIVLDTGGGLAGFSRMRPDDRTTQPSSANGGGAFSDAIELRDVVLRDFALEYQGPGGLAPVRLDHIDATMDVAPDTGNSSGTAGGATEGAASDRGWYTIGFSSGRAPGFELTIDGRLNLDTLDAEIGSLAASIDAGPDTIGTLPEPLARVLRGNDVRGRLTATGSAAADLRDISNAEASLTLHGADLNATFGEYQFPIDTLRLETTLNNGLLGLDPFEAQIHGGRVTVIGDARLTETGMPFEAALSAETLELAELLRRHSADEAGKTDVESPHPPRIAGKLTGSGTVRSELTDLRGGLSGRGTANLTEGRLFAIPGLTQLAVLVSGKDASADTAMNHRGTVEFDLGPDGARITSSEIVTNLVAARGTGTVSFDRTLDLRVNAGPLEKVQSLLGPIGDLLGGVTDRLLKYTVKGTFDDPQVGVAPLGID